VLYTLTSVMVPIGLFILSGAVAKVLLNPDLRLLARINLYVLSPALVFHCLANSRASSSSLLTLGLGTLILSFVLTGLATMWAKIRRYGRAETSGFYLATVFANAGNFGLPVTMATLGTRGSEIAIAIIVVQQILMFTLGVYLASRSNLSVSASLGSIARMPSIYAAFLAILHRQKFIIFGQPSLQLASLLTQAAIPLFLILLGAQVSSHKFEWRNSAIYVASVFRLAIAPIIALAIARLLGIDSFGTNVFVLESAMPTAVITTMLAVEYNATPAMVSCVTLLTTVASIVTIPILLTLF